MKDASFAERDEAEQQFFEKGNWATMERQHTGVLTLKPKLSTILKDQILSNSQISLKMSNRKLPDPIPSWNALEYPVQPQRNNEDVCFKSVKHLHVW